MDEICDSTYFESVLKDKVPTMTDYNKPSGIVTFSSEASSYKAWWIFDGGHQGGHNVDTWSFCFNTESNQWVQYEFENNTMICKFELNLYKQGTISNSEYYIEGSNDNSNFDILYTGITANGMNTSCLTKIGYYKYYRIRFKEQTNPGNNLWRIKSLQFYGHS